MASPRGAVAVVVDHVATAGAGRRARRACRGWAEIEPALAGFDSPAAVAAACRAARGSDQDALVSALLAVASGDEWAAVTIVAGLAGRLAWVVAGWVRAGMEPCDVGDAEAELVACCWAAIAGWGEGPRPGRPGLALVDKAWGQVRTGRRRQRRRDARSCPLPDEVPAVEVPAAAGWGRPALEVLAGVVGDAVTGERLGLRAARAVYLTRVVGLSTVEAGRLLGCTPGVLRVLRARAEHLLAA